MTSEHSSMLRIALFVSVTIGAFITNILSGVPFALLGLSAAGAASYYALVRLGDYDPRIACDHIQTGEAAIGSFALFILYPLLAGSPALPALVCAALLAYELFMGAVIAPDKKEIAIAGVLTQAIIAAAVMLITASGAAACAISPESLLLGYFAVTPPPWPLAAAVLAPSAAVLCLSHVLRPELLSYSQGPSFYDGSGGTRSGIAAGIALTRALLTATALLFAGWTCGIGVSVRRLSRARGVHAGALTIASILAFQQVVILAAREAGPWHAWGFALLLSYALCLIHLSRRNHLYDRNQKP